MGDEGMEVDMKEGGAARDGVIDFVAGALGATVSVYVGQPLDTVKVCTCRGDSSSSNN